MEYGYTYATSFSLRLTYCPTTGIVWQIYRGIARSFCSQGKLQTFVARFPEPVRKTPSNQSRVNLRGTLVIYVSRLLSME